MGEPIDSLLRTPNGKPAIAELVERLRWVVGIRWTIVVALLLVGILGGASLGEPGTPRYTHLLLAGVVAAYNLFYLFAIRRPDFGHTRASSFLSVAQIPLDLLVFTAVVHVSGGVTGPVFVLYFLYIFVGLAILPPAGAYLVAGLAILFYGMLSLLEMVWPPPFSLVSGVSPAQSSFYAHLGYFLTVSAMLLIIAYIANYFAGLLTRGERTIREQLDEINVLYSFTHTTANSLNSEAVLDTLLSSATQMEGADACSVLLFNEHGGGDMAASRGYSREELDRTRQRSEAGRRAIMDALLAGGKGVYAPDIDAFGRAADRPALRSLLVRPQARSLYAIPLATKDRLLGTLTLYFDRSYTMPRSRWILMSAMAQQAALAIERMRLFADTRRAAREMTSLYYIGLATISSLQIDEVLHLIYEQVDRVLHPDAFYIALFDEERAELRYDLFIEGNVEMPPFKTRLDNVGMASWVIRNNRPAFIRHWSVEKEQLPFEASSMGMPTQSVSAVPLVAKNKIVGVMSVEAIAPYAFDQSHMRLLAAIASQAALALENARLHAIVNEQAQHDPLTGAYNHGTLIDKLNAALARAQAERLSVALIMLDIDRFKQYNDTYGHLVGDDVLRSTVEAIQSHLKSTDVVGRWGGEEFVIVLPGVTREQARVIAERIRNTVASNVMHDMHNRPIPSATASQGIAFYPEDAIDVVDLIHRADSALYRAKGMGRNRIFEWIEFGLHSEPVRLPAAQ